MLELEDKNLFVNELCFNEENKTSEKQPSDRVTKRIGLLEEREIDYICCCEISFHNTAIFQCSIFKLIGN